MKETWRQYFSGLAWPFTRAWAAASRFLGWSGPAGGDDGPEDAPFTDDPLN